MAVSKAQQRAVAKYMAANYDELKVRVPKGKKQEIKAYAESRGESLNGFIQRAIEETMQRECSTPPGGIGAPSSDGVDSETTREK